MAERVEGKEWDMSEAKLGSKVRIRFPAGIDVNSVRAECDAMTDSISWIHIGDSGDETQIESAYPSPSSEKLNSPVVADTEEEKERLWKLVRQYASG